MPFLIGILTNLLVGLVISGVATLISSAFAPKPKPAPGTEVDVGGNVPLSFLVGTVGLAGKLEYENTWGASGGTPNAYLTAVYSLGDLPGIACTGLYENGQTLTKTASGHTTQGYPVAERQSGSSDRLWWEFFDGTQVAADSFLTGKFSSDPNYPFTSTMIGLGIPYMRMTALIDPAVWNGDPAYLFQCQGIALYDPTKDTTVGGSGSQRLATPSTWAFSDNPAVIVYNILIGIYYGSTWVWGGRFLRNSDGTINTTAVAHRLPYANWAAAINACNTAITLNAGGTEKQFRAGREIYTSEQPIDVITELLTAANARISEQAGVYTMVVGDPGSAAATFTDADIVIEETQQLEPFPSLDEVVNGATATYREPTQAWESKETAPYYNATFQTADDGRRQLVDLQLNVVFSGTQAQRIIKAQVKDARRFVRHVITLTPKWGTYRPLDVLAWTSVRNGYSAKAFLVAGMTILPNGNALVALQEIDPTDHSWTPATDEGALTFAPLIPITPAAISMTGWAAAAYIFPDSSAANRRIGISVQFTGGLSDVQFVRIQVRENFGSNHTVFDSGQQLYDPADADPVTRIITWSGIIPAQNYQVRGIFVSAPASGRVNTWSSWISVTTSNVLIGAADIGSGVITITAFASGIAAPQVVSSLASAVTAEGNLAVLTTDGRLYRYHSGAWVLEVPTNVLSGQIITAQLATAAVTANELASAAVTNVKLAALAVATANVQLSAVDSTLVANAAIVTAGLASVAVTAAKVANATLTTTQIAATTIVAGNIASGTITTTQIAATTIVAGNIAATTITSTQMAASSITTTQLAAGAVTAAKITAGTITANEIAAATITGDRLVANAITARELTLTDFTNLFPDMLLADTTAWVTSQTWTGSPTQAWNFVNNAQSSGQRSVRWSAASLTAVVGNNASYIYSYYLPVEAGRDYAFGGTIDVGGSSSGGTAQYQLRWYDSSQAVISGPTGDTVPITSGSPTAVSNIATAPATAVYARIACRINATSTTVTTTAVDFTNFFLRLANNATLIVDGTITGDKVAANTITASNLVANTLTAGTIAAGAIGTTQLAANAVTAAKIAAGTITATQIASGTITATQIAATTITAAKIVTGTITATQIIAHGVNDLQQANAAASIAMNATSAFAAVFCSKSITVTDYPVTIGGWCDFVTPGGIGTGANFWITMDVTGTGLGFPTFYTSPFQVNINASTNYIFQGAGVLLPPNGTYTVRLIMNYGNITTRNSLYTVNDSHIGIINPIV